MLLLEENDYYKNLGLELGAKSYWSRFKPDLEDRVKIYERYIGQSLAPNTLQYISQKNHTVDLMRDYANLTSMGEKNKKERLKQLETKIAEGIIHNNEIELDEDITGQIYRRLSQTREAKFLEHQRLVSEPAFSKPWADKETLNLLKGVAKYGEQAWTDLCDKYDFQAFRTPNSLAYKWGSLKIEMLETIKKIHNEKGLVISKWDWIQGRIRKLEMKCGCFLPQQQNKVENWPHKITSQTQVKQSKQEFNEPKNYKEEVKRKDVIQQLYNNYIECMEKFKESIENGTFTLDKVKKYIAGKEIPSIYPKYFESHYATLKVDDTKKAVFRLHSREEVNRLAETNKGSNTKTKEQPVGLKKLFLQKKQAQLSSTEQKMNFPTDKIPKD